MEVRYRNTLDHLIALQKHVLRNSHIGKRMMLHRFMAVEGIIIFITIVFLINHNPLKVLLGFALVTGLAWLFRERAVILQFKKDFKRERRKDDTGAFDRERVISISADGFTTCIGEETTHYPWDQVETAGRDRKNLYIILTGVLHYVIPVTAFSNEQAADTFLEAINTHRNAA